MIAVFWHECIVPALLKGIRFAHAILAPHPYPSPEGRELEEHLLKYIKGMSGGIP